MHYTTRLRINYTNATMDKKAPAGKRETRRAKSSKRHPTGDQLNNYGGSRFENA